jgi:HlyD family secretion protein
LPISGVVEEVYVKEGNLVEKDEKLLKINDDLNIETKQNLINKISLKEEELKLKKSELENSVLILKNEINEINSVLSIERYNLNKFSSVYDEGAISKIDYDAQKIKVLNYLNDLTNKKILIKVKTSELSQEIKFIQDNLFNYKTQLEEIEDILKYSIIKSPIAGYVYEINAKDKGFVIGANQDILKIVPQENLEALVFINSKDIGFVVPGQEVELNIDSYPAADFGGVDGIISFISANSRKINERDNNLFYEVKVTLNNQLIELNSGKNLPLKPGMSLSANIKLRRLSYLQLLFNLFTDKSRSIQQL